MLRHGYVPFPALFSSKGGQRRPVQQPRHFRDIFTRGQWPLLRFALLRLARLLALKATDIYFEEVRVEDDLKGIWMVAEPTKNPDVVIYYLHGGGFSMGSAWFYLEFLMAWTTLLRDGVPTTECANEAGRKTFHNPAVFALDYSLVPTETFPVQLNQAMQGYKFALSMLNSSASSKENPSLHDQKGPETVSPPLVVSGDSAGATLVLSLLLRLAQTRACNKLEDATPIPRLATLISPWCTLISPRNVDTPSDYLNASSLHLYASQYLRNSENSYLKSTDETYGVSLSEIASPGSLFDENPQHLELWRNAIPTRGCYIINGAEEVFGPETRRLQSTLEKVTTRSAFKESGIPNGTVWEAWTKAKNKAVTLQEKKAGIHAWPIVALFLGENREDITKRRTGTTGRSVQNSKFPAMHDTGAMERLEGVRELALACIQRV